MASHVVDGLTAIAPDNVPSETRQGEAEQSNRAAEDFVKAYIQHWDRLYRYALQELESPDTAEDIVQETFVRAWKNNRFVLQPKNEHTDSNRWWLNSTLRTLCGQEVEYEKGTEPVEDMEPYLPVDTSAEELPKRLLLRDYLQTAYNAMSEKEFSAFVAIDIQGLSYDEYSAAQGITRPTVNRCLYRARYKFEIIMESLLEKEARTE